MNRGFESRTTRLIFGIGWAVHLRYGTFPLRPSLFNFDFIWSNRFLSYTPMAYRIRFHSREDIPDRFGFGTHTAASRIFIYSGTWIPNNFIRTRNPKNESPGSAMVTSIHLHPWYIALTLGSDLPTLPSSSTSSSSKSVVRLPHPQALFRIIPNSHFWIGDPLSSVSSISGVPEPPSPPHLPSSHRPVHDMSLANRTVSEMLNFSLPSAKFRRLAGLSPKLNSWALSEMVRTNPMSCLDWLGRPALGMPLVREMFRAVLVRLGVGRMYHSLAFYHFCFHLSSSLFVFISWFSTSTLPHVCNHEYMK